MKYYIIYRNNKFVGFTTSFEMLQIFLKSRKHKKYMVRIMKENNIDKDILNSEKLSDYELSYYNGYSITYELPVIEYEREMLDEELYNYLCDVYATIEYFIKKLKYIRFDSEEDETEVKLFLNSILQEIFSIFEQAEPAYDEVVDVTRFFMKYIIDKPHELKGDKVND